MSDSAAPSTEPQSIEEMMRIMDVATALRKEREIVERELNRDQLKDHLRQRLLSAAEVTGERVTPEEVDVAIERYYDRLYAYAEPPRRFSTMLAHAYVRRGMITAIVIPLLILGACVWLFFLSPWAPFSETARTQRAVAATTASINSHADAIRAVASGTSARSQFEQLLSEAAAYEKHRDVDGLQTVDQSLADLRSQLEGEYEIHVISKPDLPSAVDRYFTDDAGERVSGYYLIVEARTATGEILQHRIRNSESGAEETVTRWGERVPKEIYDRLATDKREDGILNETLFAVKRRGVAEEEIKMTLDDGVPVERKGQITSW